MRQNPYVVGPAVKDYPSIKGRYEETHKILSILRGSHQDNVPLVWGDRRIGRPRCSIGLSLDPEVRRHYEPVLCDFEGIVRRHDLPGGLVKRFAKRIQRTLTGTPLGRVPLIFDDRADSLDQFQDYSDRLSMASGQKNLLLMMDEIELFFDHLRSEAEDAGAEKGPSIAGEFVQLLRHNMQHNPKVSFILSGTKRLLALASQVGERLFHLPVTIRVGELSESDASALITEPVGDAFDYSTAAKAELLRLTAQHPYLLQGVCHEIFSFMLDHRLSVASTAEVKEVLKERVFQADHLFRISDRDKSVSRIND